MTKREAKLAERNPNWRGDSPGMPALHEWVRYRLVEPAVCSQCGQSAPPLDLANISQKYLRDLSDWEWLCRKCHMLKDGRLERFKEAAMRRRRGPKGRFTSDEH